MAHMHIDRWSGIKTGSPGMHSPGQKENTGEKLGHHAPEEYHHSDTKAALQRERVITDRSSSH